MATNTSTTVITGDFAGAFPDALKLFGAPEALAPAGSTQADAQAITKAFAVVTGADGTKGNVLPAIAAAGQTCVVYNATATNGLKLYPASGSAINGGTVDVNISLEGKTLALLVATSTTNWAAIFTINA